MVSTFKEDYDPNHPIKSTLKGTEDILTEATKAADEVVSGAFETLKGKISPEELAQEKIGKAVESAMNNTELGAEQIKNLHPKLPRDPKNPDSIVIESRTETVDQPKSINPVTHPREGETKTSGTSQTKGPTGNEGAYETSDYRNNTLKETIAPSRSTGVKDLDEGVAEAAKRVVEPITKVAKDVKDYTVDKVKNAASGAKNKWNEVSKAEQKTKEDIADVISDEYTKSEKEAADKEGAAVPKAKRHERLMGVEMGDQRPSNMPRSRVVQGIGIGNADPVANKGFEPPSKPKQKKPKG
ncbi:hypothetical protein QYM36_003946 [Artemia franciscana]|uniref:Uncharacterized protein n=2 Tax=Artemia franciscana TaxID=6661 RepID=A0AA88I5J2_ARTSF|nr:hypothetical protein QYM36_003946 [Artemia franciscana]